MTRLALSMLLLATIPASTPVPPLSAGGQPSVKPESLPGKAVTRLRNGGRLSAPGSRALHRPARRADRDEQRAPLWDRLAQCESGRRWHFHGYFDGGLQFTQRTWASFGGLRYAARADLATRIEQIATAERVLRVQGWHAWPTCSVTTGIAR